MNELSVIITIANEGPEVLNTLRSFKEKADLDFNIILINDASTDKYNYKKIADEYKALYIEHSERQGPAMSRNEGILACTTKYFLLLDAHMRIFNEHWTSILLSELRKENNGLFCCSTLTLDKEGKLCENIPTAYGAFINIEDLSVHWIYDLEHDVRRCIEVPCVLGASYACSKRYWRYLKGLEGLRGYGFEEQLISIKVLLSGGKCFVMKDIKCGHIFRNASEAPYEIPTDEYYLNQLFIVELLYNSEYKQKFIRRLRKLAGNEHVNSWMDKLTLYKTEIVNQKEYYKDIFQQDFSLIINQNRKNNSFL